MLHQWLSPKADLVLPRGLSVSRLLRGCKFYFVHAYVFFPWVVMNQPSQDTLLEKQKPKQFLVICRVQK
jgi:hypothetical protein